MKYWNCIACSIPADTEGAQTSAPSEVVEAEEVIEAVPAEEVEHIIEAESSEPAETSFSPEYHSLLNFAMGHPQISPIAQTSEPVTVPEDVLCEPALLTGIDLAQTKPEPDQVESTISISVDKPENGIEINPNPPSLVEEPTVPNLSNESLLASLQSPSEPVAETAPEEAPAKPKYTLSDEEFGEICATVREYSEKYLPTVKLKETISKRFVQNVPKEVYSGHLDAVEKYEVPAIFDPLFYLIPMFSEDPYACMGMFLDVITTETMKEDNMQRILDLIDEYKNHYEDTDEEEDEEEEEDPDLPTENTEGNTSEE
jgi:hypothetical protein